MEVSCKLAYWFFLPLNISNISLSTSFVIVFSLIIQGLGTSSILAGAVIAVLWKASGKTFDNLSLIHAVSKQDNLNK